MALTWYATWTVDQYISEFLPSIRHEQACNIISLFQENCSLPFIARYKTDRTGNATVEELRKAYELFKEAECVNKKIGSLLNSLPEAAKSDESLVGLVRQSKSAEEISELRSCLGVARKSTLKERALSAGLEPVARRCLEVGLMFNSEEYRSEAFPTAESVSDAVRALIGRLLLTKPSIRNLLDLLEQRDSCRVVVTVTANALTRRLAGATETQGSASTSKGRTAERQSENFSHYFNFRSSVGALKPHQVMAINRGIKRKVLRKRFTVPESWPSSFAEKATELMGTMGSKEARDFVASCSKNCYTKLVRPWLVSRLWNRASMLARIRAVECFATNLRSLLLSPPLKDHSIIGVDPGFTHGCKYAMISAQGDILASGIFYLPQVKDPQFELATSKFCDFAVFYRCDRIAVGNGKGCQQTMTYLRCLIQEGRFRGLDVLCRVVNESGSSVYSISPSADKEMPQLQPNLRSAVSIARRVLDPLSEYIKIGPAHLSVGMYQHDIPSKVLKANVDMVVEECVSFVGVDLNTCSVDLLAHVTGLDKRSATAICQFRAVNGPFVCRLQLAAVKGLSSRAFRMCSGFVRIHGRRGGAPPWEANPLDATSIHPESYSIVTSLLRARRMSLMDLYDERARHSFAQWLSEASEEKISIMANSNCTVHASLEFIAESLLNYGVSSVFTSSASDFLPPLAGGTISDLRSGTVLQGTVKNVTTFGVFVDIGANRDGMIPMRLLPRVVPLQVGNQVCVSVTEVDTARNRITLSLIEHV